MSLLGTLGDFVNQATSPGALEADVHGAYDDVARTAPPGALADGLTHAFNSDQTPPFEEMVSGMFSRSNPNQKAGLINQILGSLQVPKVRRYVRIVRPARTATAPIAQAHFNDTGAVFQACVAFFTAERPRTSSRSATFATIREL